MNKYSYDINEIKRFVNALPDLEEKYVYLLMLCVRSRYAKELLGVKVRDTVLLRDFVIWGDKWRDALIRRILRMIVLAKNSEMVFRVKDLPVPSIATGIVIVINPARVDTAYIDFIKEITSDIINALWDRVAKMEKLWFSCLHKRTKRRFHTIDVDSKDENIISHIESVLEKYGKWYMKIETVRGFHYVIDLKNIDTRYFTNFMKKELPELSKKYIDEENKPIIEYKKDPLEPIPGTMYGGFLVKLHEINKT